MPDKLSLARLPTPVEHLPRLSARYGVDLRVKRDDLTGVALSGNKVRKLEYLVADALARGADTLVTCGAHTSNHCRATAVVAARVGLHSALLLRTADGEPPPRPWDGNLRIAELVGARCRFVNAEQYSDYDTMFEAAVESLEAEGRRPYVVPEGGSNALGSLGYADAYDEIVEQFPDADTVVAAMGSGGTAAGLVMGYRRRGGGPRPVAVNVCNDEAFFRDRLASILGDPARDDLRILDGFKGRGYGLSSEAELSLLRQVAVTEGLILDPVYTAKAFLGMVESLDELGERVLFVHTGGIFGHFGRPAAAAP